MSSACVVGAGVFGASLARELALRDWDVTLVEQYTPGTVRSASGGDTRLLRAAHGDAEWYTASAVRARTLWLELEQETGTAIWEGVGLAWLARRGDGFEAASVPVSTASGSLTSGSRPTRRAGCSRRSPSTTCTACSTSRMPACCTRGAPPSSSWPTASGTASRSRDRGSRRATIRPATSSSGRAAPGCRSSSPSSSRSRSRAATSSSSAATARWQGAPGFVDYDGGFYGHGDVGGLGIKIAPDSASDTIDPDTLDRVPSPDWEEQARSYAARRFPSLAGAPVLGGRVCQYDLSADTHFIVDRHPERDRWWLVGGGSGHSFKHGPALAEYVADCIEGRREREPFHALGPRTGDAGLRTGSA